jgi:DUF4097 and DUF4098 domain-containing protein YvlB
MRLALLLAVPSLLHAEDWSKTFPLTGEPTLKVETSDANIHVDTWDQNSIEAHVTAEGWKIGEHDLRITAAQAGNAVEIEVHFPHNVELFSFNLKVHEVEIAIHMPRRGQVNLHTGDGSIYVNHLQGQMTLQSGDGHQEIAAVEGALHARAGDGNIQVEGKFSGLDLTTGDGRIEARALTGSSVGSGWSLLTGDGSVTLLIPAEFSAELDLHTGDGHITTDMPVAVEGRMAQNNVHGKLNAGGAPLRIHTGDGSIHLKRLDAI